jgi:predicted alpha/beta hydrolase
VVNAIQAVRLDARDGYSLGATLHRPDSPNGAAVVIHAAAGVRQEYYAKFAAYLAERGFSALTFDYRGIGSSCPPRLRGFKATMRDWAVLDAAAALDFLGREAPGARISVVGHSFGGQCLGIVPGNERYTGVLAVASQSGYWRHWSGSGRAGMWLATHVVLPGLSRLLGYFPARLLGQGEDLPAGMAIEWARWCRHPGYIVGALGEKERYARFRAPVRLVWVADDNYAPRAAADALLDFYPSAPRELHAVHPEALGVQRIGHFGFFRERFRATLWKDAADWLAGKR